MAEIAGFILAALPLVISGLEHYADGVTTITKWWSYKRELKSLTRVLDAEYARFLVTCEKILDGLVSPKQLQDLLRQPGGPSWSEAALNKKLRIRLQRSYSPYLRSVEDMANAVKDLETKLELGEDGKVSPSCSSCRYLPYADQLTQPKWGSYHKFKDEYKRVKFSLSRRSYEDSMKRIEKNNDLLANLTDQNMELEPARKRRRRSGLQFKSIQEHAANLYSVISEGWTCKCTMAHQANLRLDDRLSDPEPDPTQDFTHEISTASPIQFKVLFSIDGKPLSSDLSHLWQETEIRVLQEREQENDPPEPTLIHQGNINTLLSKGLSTGTTTVDDSSLLSTLSLHVKNNLVTSKKDQLKASSQKGVKFTEPPRPTQIAQSGSGASSIPSSSSKKGVKFAVISSANSSNTYGPPTDKDLADLVKIDNLCLVIQQCLKTIQYNQKCLGYLSCQTHYRLGVYLPPTPPKPPQSPNITSLAELLSNKQPTHSQFLAPTGNLPLSRGERLGLALTIASSVLQLHNTPWLRQDWDKNDIMIIDGYTSNTRQQAYVSRSFPPVRLEDSPTAQRSALPLRNVTLFALGKVLIELCLGQPLEALRTPEYPVDATGTAKIFTDWSTANRLIETVYSEGGTRYGDAVRRCLHCEFDQRNTNLEDDAFRQAVYDGVVAPLEDDVKAFYDR